MRVLFGCAASLAILLFAASSWLLGGDPIASAGRRSIVQHDAQPSKPPLSRAVKTIPSIVDTVISNTIDGAPADRDAGRMDANGTLREFNVTSWARGRARYLLRHWVDGVDPWFELGAGNRTHEGTCVLVIVDGKIHGNCETACPNNRCTPLRHDHHHHNHNHHNHNHLHHHHHHHIPVTPASYLLGRSRACLLSFARSVATPSWHSLYLSYLRGVCDVNLGAARCAYGCSHAHAHVHGMTYDCVPDHHSKGHAIIMREAMGMLGGRGARVLDQKWLMTCADKDWPTFPIEIPDRTAAPVPVSPSFQNNGLFFDVLYGVHFLPFVRAWYEYRPRLDVATSWYSGASTTGGHGHCTVSRQCSSASPIGDPRPLPSTLIRQRTLYSASLLSSECRRVAT